ncbi:hypothetical protein [Williamsia phyllosphaerae]|uniref:DUF2530 domain-containing protein n=1 Tax=Williamsia phyllosphaerae TaxID=885042 RepID=A0ABQ1V619_9NOCA|nr:hypothetical protein [Williamsia phyllosphaerae]GGF39224.1 hypothetical protein GCM10007298_38650 [Williamsia phyllosphaerae]
MTPEPDDDHKPLRDYYGADKDEPSSGGFSVPQWVIVTLVSIVTVVWAGSLILDAFVKSYDPPATISLAFMAVVSALLGSGVVRSLPRRKGRDDEN